MGKRSRRHRDKKSDLKTGKELPVKGKVLTQGKEGKFIFPCVITCFFLSGFAALLYQTSWLRQFSTVFGTSEIAVVMLLAAYMAGLAIGAALAGRFIDHVKRPILVYGVLEAGIAVSALSVPFLLAASGALYSGLLGGQPVPPDAESIGQTTFYLCVGFIILVLPTGLMGATLPLLTRHVVTNNSQIGPRVGVLYGVNTVGAVAGTLSAGFVLLPALGLDGTVYIGVVTNIVIFLVAAYLSRYPVLSRQEIKTDQASADIRARSLNPDQFNSLLHVFSGLANLRQRIRPALTRHSGWILPIIAISGAVSFYYEILWTRLLSHVVGSSIYAFATMLATFLSGIALGSTIAGYFSRDREQATVIFAWVQMAIGALSIIVYASLEPLNPGVQDMYKNAVYSAAIMLPATIFIGATFPLAVRIISHDESDAAPITAHVYSWNTAGAILGTIMAGFYLVPALGFEGSIRLAVMINFMLALLTLILVGSFRPVMAVIVVVIIVMTGIAYHPARPTLLISNSPYEVDGGESARQEIYYAVGRSSTVYMAEYGGWARLRTNGLPEASIAAKGSPPALHNQRWLSALPVAARPDAKSMLIIGYGGGIALEGAPESIDNIDVIELEPEVINANRELKDYRDPDPLEDPRVNVIINDARNALGLTSKRYDIIVSQPSHPWTAGASHLFTREFLEISRKHLKKDGVIVQWMNSNFVDERLLGSMAATLLDVFSYARLYQPSPGTLFFLASDSTLKIEHEIARTGRPLSDHLYHYAMLGLNSIEDFVVTIALDESGLAALAKDAEIITDDKNLMAVRSRYQGNGMNLLRTHKLLRDHDPLMDAQSWVYTDFGGKLNFGYIGTRLLHNRMVHRANQLANTVPDRSTGLFLHAMGLSFQGKGEEATKYLRRSITEDSDNLQARFAMVKNHLGSLVTGNASEEVRMFADSLIGSPATVIQGWHDGLNEKWLSLARRDRELAKSETTDIWYTEAAKMRAEWRTKVTSDNPGDRLVVDALRIIDRALILTPELDLYVLRAACGILLQDPWVFIQSLRSATIFIKNRLDRAEKGEYQFSPLELSVTRRRLEAMKKGLELPFATPIQDHVYEARTKLDELIDKLEIKN